MKRFDNDLADLQQRVAKMAALAQGMVELVAAAVRDRSRDVRQQLDEHEATLDQMQTDIDHEAVRILTVYSPVATQLRYVLGVTHITAQLERIGDQVINVCEALDLMQSETDRQVQADLQKMAGLVNTMVSDATSCYFDRDERKAEVTRGHDDAIDALHAQITKKLLSDEVLHNVLKGTQDVADALAQILIARHLERIADQAVNICKEVVFLVRGDDVRHTETPHD